MNADEGSKACAYFGDRVRADEKDQAFFEVFDDFQQEQYQPVPLQRSAFDSARIPGVKLSRKIETDLLELIR